MFTFEVTEFVSQYSLDFVGIERVDEGVKKDDTLIVTKKSPLEV